MPSDAHRRAAAERVGAERVFDTFAPTVLHSPQLSTPSRTSGSRRERGHEQRVFRAAGQMPERLPISLAGQPGRRGSRVARW
jgi:hypothetical protein